MSLYALRGRVPAPQRFGPFVNVRLRTGVQTVRIAAIISVEPAWFDGAPQDKLPGSIIRLVSGSKVWTKHLHHDWLAFLKSVHPNDDYASVPVLDLAEPAADATGLAPESLTHRGLELAAN